MKYFKVFNTEAEYTSYLASDDYISPNVSTLRDSSATWIGQQTQDYSKQYLTFVVTVGGNISFSGSTAENVLSYSIDSGETWLTADSSTTITVAAGDTVLWKGTPSPQSNKGIGKFSGDSVVRYDVNGNVMSLLYGDNFRKQYSLVSKDNAFYGLFSGNTNVVGTEDLILPATTLSSSCYRGMFDGCSSLITTPELPATTLNNACYRAMFANCSSLTTAPELHATILANDCYRAMFANCSSLTTAPSSIGNSTTIIQYSACTSMFQGCVSLTTAPSLPATALTDYCYQSMFQGCTSLTTIQSALPATTLAKSCYNSMFKGCRSLTTAPSLPATALTDYCYQGMFSGCTSLTTIQSTLPATTLAKSCYNSMFDNCTSLITAPSLPATALTDYCYQSMFQGCTSLTTVTELPATIMSNSCYSLMFKNCTSLVTPPVISATTLAVSACTNMFQYCSSLTTAPELLATTLEDSCYYYMFGGCTSLERAPELLASTLVNRCYKDMFNGCTRLNYIKCLATDISATDCTDEWVYHVQNESGTFIKNSLMEDWTTGIHGIPSNWTVYNDSYITVTGVTLSTGSTTIDKGNTYTLTATVLPSDAADKTVSWSTSDSSIATVANGVITGVGCGNATITVTTHDGGYTAQCNVSVEKHVTSVDLNTYVATINSGGTYQLIPTIYPNDACNTAVTWSSSDSTIASVDSTGLVSGVTTGSATVAVTTVDGSFSKNCSITVNGGQHATGVSISEAFITITANTTYTLAATVLPADAVNKNVTWSSSDSNVATVNSNGVISGVASGSATITVTTVDGGFTAQCEVNCVERTLGYFTLRSLADGNSFRIGNNTGTDRYFSYSLDNGNSWTSFTLEHNARKNFETINSGDTIMIKGNNPTLATAWSNGCYFRGSQNYEVEGNISSLLNNNDTDVEITGGTLHFAAMFSGDTHLISADNLKILSTTLYESSFNSCFRDCTNLQKAPDLSVPTTLGKETYSSMFEGCTSLSQPPSVLSATTAQLSSYKRMFCMNRSSKVTTNMTKSPIMIGDFGSETTANDMQIFCGNGSLTEIKCFWTNNSHTFGSLANWVNYTADSGVTFYKRSTQTFANGVNGIKTSWTIVNDDNTGN